MAKMVSCSKYSKGIWPSDKSATLTSPVDRSANVTVTKTMAGSETAGALHEMLELDTTSAFSAPNWPNKHLVRSPSKFDPTNSTSVPDK
eukprot:1831136-Rhodomonas_salina.1